MTLWVVMHPKSESQSAVFTRTCFLTAVYAKMTGDEPKRYSDGFMDLATEYDQLAGVDVISIHDHVMNDAIKYSDQVPSNLRKKRLARTGSVRLIRNSES